VKKYYLKEQIMMDTVKQNGVVSGGILPLNITFKIEKGS
jgi:hypothetical protein